MTTATVPAVNCAANDTDEGPPDPPAPPLPPSFISTGVPPAPPSIWGAWWDNLKSRLKEATKNVPKSVIIGVAVGGTALLVGLAGFGGLWCYCRRRHRKEEEAAAAAATAKPVAARRRVLRVPRPAHNTAGGAAACSGAKAGGRTEGSKQGAAVNKAPGPMDKDGQAAATHAARGTPVVSVAAAMPPANSVCVATYQAAAPATAHVPPAAATYPHIYPQSAAPMTQPHSHYPTVGPAGS